MIGCTIEHEYKLLGNSKRKYIVVEDAAEHKEEESDANRR